MNNETQEKALPSKHEDVFPLRTTRGDYLFLGKAWLCWLLAFLILRFFVFVELKFLPEGYKAATISLEFLRFIFFKNLPDFFLYMAIFLSMLYPFSKAFQFNKFYHMIGYFILTSFLASFVLR